MEQGNMLRHFRTQCICKLIQQSLQPFNRKIGYVESLLEDTTSLMRICC